MNVDLTSLGLPPEFVLFGEDASRVVISCDRDNFARIEQVALKYGIAAELIGETASERIEIKLDGRVVVSATVAELRQVYEGALEKALRAEPEPVAAN
jgi:phosphoribosylformylglycinamidine synthase